MSDPQAPLKNMEKKHEYLIAIDSDGCTFDTMELKQKECFIPNIIKHWRLQPVSRFAREVAEFINLYSKWRGINRFPGLIITFDMLKDWPDVHKRKAVIPAAQALRDWISCGTRLSNPALQAELEKNGDPVLKQALQWSEAVNTSVADMVFGVPPFAYVRESLQKIFEWADIIVCSGTPGEALAREWQEHDIAKFARVIAGQEMGSKKEHIHLASNGKYDKDKILMIGDAPGDMKAARGNGALFFPINPGDEDASWEFFYSEASGVFRNGNYDKAYEDKLVAEFEKLLPEVPLWKR